MARRLLGHSARERIRTAARFGDRLAGAYIPVPARPEGPPTNIRSEAYWRWERRWREYDAALDERAEWEEAYFSWADGLREQKGENEKGWLCACVPFCGEFNGFTESYVVELHDVWDEEQIHEAEYEEWFLERHPWVLRDMVDKTDWRVGPCSDDTE